MLKLVSINSNGVRTPLHTTIVREGYNFYVHGKFEANLWCARAVLETDDGTILHQCHFGTDVAPEDTFGFGGDRINDYLRTRL